MTDYDDPPDVDDVIAGGTVAFEPDIRHAPSTPIGAHAVNWRTLADKDAAAEWAQLREWVEWFTVRYRISESTVPVCWYLHGQLVEELSALHSAHVVSFHSTDTGYGPIGWHERLSLALPRLTRAYSGGCTRGHSEHKPRSWTGVTDETAWAAWTAGAHDHRDTAGVSQRKEEG